MLQVRGRDVGFQTTKEGEFWRILLPGIYTMEVFAEGFAPREVQFAIVEQNPTMLNVTLYPVRFYIFSPNPWPLHVLLWFRSFYPLMFWSDPFWLAGHPAKRRKPGQRAGSQHRDLLLQPAVRHPGGRLRLPLKTANHRLSCETSRKILCQGINLELLKLFHMWYLSEIYVQFLLDISLLPKLLIDIVQFTQYVLSTCYYQKCQIPFPLSIADCSHKRTHSLSFDSLELLFQHELLPHDFPSQCCSSQGCST